MSWRASAYVKELVVCPNGERITQAEKLVALVLADSHQDKGAAYTFPAMKMIAEDSLMDPRVCRRHLGALERKGVIARLRAQNQGRGQVTFYRFPALDGPKEGGHGVPLSAVEKRARFLAQKEDRRRTEGGQKEDKSRTLHIEEQEQEQKQIQVPPPNPLDREGDGATEKNEHTSKTETSADSVAIDGDAERAVELDAREGMELPRSADGLGAGGTQQARGAGGAAPDAPGAALVSAVDQVMQGCGFTARRMRRVLGEQLALEADKGEPVPTAALHMIAQWKSYVEHGPLQKARWGPQRFFAEGHWRDARGWMWDNEELRDERRRAAARVGS